MKTKVMTRLEPKAKSYGFSKDELMTVCESIANGFGSEEEATEEAIDDRINAMLPILKLSQSAANRSYERMKAKFEEESKSHQQQQQKQVEEPAKEPEKEADEMPSWFKAFKEKYDADQKATDDRFNTMRREKANESYVARVKAGLKDVDPKFYSRDLNGRTFESEEEVDSYVSEVVGDWTTFCSDRNIRTMKDLVPPGGNDKPVKPNENVMNRVEARKAEETKSAIKGL